MTPEQKAAIAAKLGADLATLDSDRLIELCLLHRAQPKALESFPNTLAAEINRRFTAAEITRDDVPYSVLQHFANQFTGVIPLAQRLLHEMAASVNRDIWFTDNAAAFKDVLNNADSAKWLAGQTDVLEKALNNRLALTMIAESETAATAILSQADAVTLWKNAPGLWEIWPQHREGMTVIAKSAELTQYIIDTPAALAAVVASDNAMQPLIASANPRQPNRDDGSRFCYRCPENRAKNQRFPHGADGIQYGISGGARRCLPNCQRIRLRLGQTALTGTGRR